MAKQWNRSRTLLVKDIAAGSASSMPTRLTAVGSTVYFSAFDSTSGYELWKSDGTATGTTLVKDIALGNNSSYLQELVAVGNILFFSAFDSTAGRELWRSDGTLAGTLRVKDIDPQTSSLPVGLTNHNGTLVFGANDGVNGTEFWKSNGTATGTVLVKDILGGTASSMFFGEFNRLGNSILFTAETSAGGAELWKSDGTSSGTVLVKDIRPGNYGSEPRKLVEAGGWMYFRADDGTNGVSCGGPMAPLLVQAWSRTFRQVPKAAAQMAC